MATDRQLHADKYGNAAFYGWSESAARRVSQPEGLEELRRFLDNPSPAIRYWLDPREEEGRFVFDEIEAVILAERP